MQATGGFVALFSELFNQRISEPKRGAAFLKNSPPFKKIDSDGVSKRGAASLKKSLPPLLSKERGIRGSP